MQKETMSECLIFGIMCKKEPIICGDGKKDELYTFTVPGWETCSTIGIKSAKRIIKGRLDPAVRNMLGIQ